jgi:hypothetical protein
VDRQPQIARAAAAGPVVQPVQAILERIAEPGTVRMLRKCLTRADRDRDAVVERRIGVRKLARCGPTGALQRIGVLAKQLTHLAQIFEPQRRPVARRELRAVRIEAGEVKEPARHTCCADAAVVRSNRALGEVPVRDVHADVAMHV